MRIEKRAKRDEARLAELFKKLKPEPRGTLLAFAEFLAQQEGNLAQTEPIDDNPHPEPRPKKESVVGAIKRLSRVYHMLDRGTMLTETSALMSDHVLNGRPAPEVIDELEVLFAARYEGYRNAE